jgi:hypothetical protein
MHALMRRCNASHKGVTREALNRLECPAIFVPVEMRQTGTRGAGYGARKEAYG